MLMIEFIGTIALRFVLLMLFVINEASLMTTSFRGETYLKFTIADPLLTFEIITFTLVTQLCFILHFSNNDPFVSTPTSSPKNGLNPLQTEIQCSCLLSYFATFNTTFIYIDTLSWHLKW